MTLTSRMGIQILFRREPPGERLAPGVVSSQFRSYHQQSGEPARTPIWLIVNNMTIRWPAQHTFSPATFYDFRSFKRACRAGTKPPIQHG
jgi:hypothetical protein